MTAEPIAAVVADIRKGRVRHLAERDAEGRKISELLLGRAQKPQPVVDCTAIYDAQIEAKNEVSLYDDHPSIVSPWADALFCYVNRHQNVIAMQVSRFDWDGTKHPDGGWEVLNEAEWPRIRWISETTFWVGGQSGAGVQAPTAGPCHILRHAIRDDGSPADINWVALTHRQGQWITDSELRDPHASAWDHSTVMIGAALNFLNASNVEVAEPKRPFPVRQRLRKSRVQVQAIVVRPPGKRRQSMEGVRAVDALDSPLSSVRGHFARYGVEGRGLLFGKYSGKFWIPAHARVQGESVPRDYVLKPGSAA